MKEQGKISGIIHIRRSNGVEKAPMSNGGYTMVYRIGSENAQGRMIEVAFARCVPTDPFNRKQGTAIATGRLNCERASVRYRFAIDCAQLVKKDGTKPIFKDRDGLIYVDDKQFPLTQLLVETFAEQVISGLEIPQEYEMLLNVDVNKTDTHWLYNIVPAFTADNCRIVSGVSQEA